MVKSCEISNYLYFHSLLNSITSINFLHYFNPFTPTYLLQFLVFSHFQAEIMAVGRWNFPAQLDNSWVLWTFSRPTFWLFWFLDIYRGSRDRTGTGLFNKFFHIGKLSTYYINNYSKIHYFNIFFTSTLFLAIFLNIS